MKNQQTSNQPNHKSTSHQSSRDLYQKISEKTQKQGQNISTFLKTALDDTIEITSDVYKIIDRKIVSHLDQQND